MATRCEHCGSRESANGCNCLDCENCEALGDWVDTLEQQLKDARQIITSFKGIVFRDFCLSPEFRPYVDNFLNKTGNPPVFFKGTSVGMTEFMGEYTPEEKIENKIVGYEEIVNAIKEAPMTYLPALTQTVIQTGVVKKVFSNNNPIPFVENIIKQREQ